MWRVLTRLPSLLSELLHLQRESNALMRELVLAISGRPALTPPTPGAEIPMASRPAPTRKLQASDVTVVTREARLSAQAREIDRRNRPWADPSRSESGAPGTAAATPTPALPSTGSSDQ